MSKIFDVVIIGAGIAGLKAGNVFQSKGKIDFVVLESAQEIGGRVRTVSFGDRTFAIGPGWVHGKNENPIYDILQELNVETKICKTFNVSNTFAWDREAKKDVTNDFIETRNSAIQLIADLKRQLVGKKIDPEKSFKDILSTYSNYFDNLTDLKKTVLYVTFEIFFGAPLSDVSGLSELQFDKLYDSDGKMVDFLIKNPSDLLKLVHYLSKDFKDQIELNCKVSVIEWNNDSNLVTVIAKDGRQFVARNVIITVQSGLLAKNSIVFRPELPKEKVASWAYVPAINYCRLFAKFPHRFWPKKDWFVSVLHDANPLFELILWRHYDSSYVDSEYDNILVCHFTTGYKYEKNHFDVDKESLIQLVTKAMKNIFPDSYCEPNDVLLMSHWNTDRFAGSFSITAPGLDETIMENLSKSVGPLHFAGESVMLDFIGTMQGAFLSGLRAAEKCL